jgi:hypothetical protein
LSLHFAYVQHATIFAGEDMGRKHCTYVRTCINVRCLHTTAVQKMSMIQYRFNYQSYYQIHSINWFKISILLSKMPCAQCYSLSKSYMMSSPFFSLFRYWRIESIFRSSSRLSHVTVMMLRRPWWVYPLLGIIKRIRGENHNILFATYVATGCSG